MRKALWLAALTACTTPAQPPPGTAGPAEAVRDLAAALQKGDAATAWSLLSTRTQKEADELAAKARAQAGDAGPDSGRAMLFGSAIPAAATQTRVVSQSGDSAEVQAGEDGGGRVYRVVREGGVWRVDLDLSR
ncbi:MAG TPA: hypothetical protein VFE90_06250 [Myxococcales bacterium]|jgi:hypothetical protein|nr:hypothetical protein [Myxococcales bacterium]